MTRSLELDMGHGGEETDNMISHLEGQGSLPRLLTGFTFVGP